MAGKEVSDWISKNFHEQVGRYPGLTSLNKDNLAWILKTIVETKAEKFEILLREKYDPEEIVLRYLCNMLREMSAAIQKDTDARRALVRYFALCNLDDRLGSIEDKIESIPTGDKKAVGIAAEALNELVEAAKKTHPEFITKNEYRINEDYGDLLALGNRGRLGSIRKITEIEQREKQQIKTKK